MAEIVAGLVGPVVEHIGKFIAAPIKREFTYLCCFKSNTQSLSDETEKLNTERDELQMKVDRAKRNNEVIVRNVQKWLDDCGEIQRKTSEIQAEITNPPSGCLAMRSRYLLSKKAKNTANDVNDLLERCKFVEISHPAPPPGTVPPPMPLGPLDEFPSRKQIAEKIMEDLRGGKIYMMGLCGMGGVGKTTMAKRIMDKVWEEKLFDEVVMATVSQPVDQREIQGEIASSLGLELKLNDSLQVRADNLCTRLMAGKKILLILDDVWEELDLKELGIPCKSDVGRGCTIVLTSRNKEVLNKMDARPYAMEILSEEEAWFLFREKVGTWVELSDLLSTSKEVAKECKGLPLALTVVGTTLKNEKEKYVWKDALCQLKNPDLAMPDLLEDVYKPLKLSYESLKPNSNERSLFLLCCIFPEDHNIHLEYLTLFGIGLRMFEDMSVEEARNRVRRLLKMLKGRFLLLDGWDENYVKMHDVVRDVATFIATDEGRVGRNLSNCRCISVIGEQINRLPIDLSFPSLRLFLMGGLGTYPPLVEISINSSFFQGKEELNVLCFGGISFRSLPETTKLLKNLRTLYLNRCNSLETISIVGELLSLEILICRYCDKIAELPIEIGRLERLKLLEVSNCENLKRIAPEVISKLVQLEELIIVGSFVGWERKANGKQRVNAALCELEHLKNLTTLAIEIEDLSLVTEEMCFSTKILNHHIRFMSKSSRDFLDHESGMDLILGKDVTLARWIHVFLRSTHSLSATGDGSNSLDLAQMQNLKRLVYRDCSTLNKLVNIPKASNSFNCPKLSKLFPLSMAKYGLLLLEKLEIKKCEMMEEVFANEENEKDRDQFHMITFPKLKCLILFNLPRLTTFCKGSESIKGSSNNLNLEGHDADSFHLFCNQKVSFGSLMEIIIEGLHSTHKLFSSAIIKDGQLQLEKLKIKNCKMMEEVFSNEENGMDGVQYCHTITFPKLKSLCLEDLPRLTSFCKGSENIEFPLLEEIDISNCNKLISLISSTYDNLNLEGHDHNFVPLFCKVSFGKSLEKITVHYCDGIRSLFSSSIAANLVNLKELDIWKCNEMVKVIEDSDEDMVAADQKSHCKLDYLSLDSLPKLQSFCNWRCDHKLPSLKHVEIKACPLLKLESVIFGSLKNIDIGGRDDISSLFSFSIAKKLVNLKELRISNCNEMIKVIEDIDEEMLTVDHKPHFILFPSLKELKLENLPKLQSFCNWRCDLKMPSLEHVKILECPLLEFFTMGSLSTPNLKFINWREYNHVGDLNSAIQQLHFETNQYQPISTPKETTASDKEEPETDQAENEIEKTEMEEETLISSDIQAGAEEDHQKSEIQEAEQINEELTSTQMKE